MFLRVWTMADGPSWRPLDFAPRITSAGQNRSGMVPRNGVLRKAGFRETEEPPP